MILIADCGSTKTDWCICDGRDIVRQIKTQGFNPALQSSDEIHEILITELAGQIDGTDIDKVYFYGAGCAYEEANNRVKTALIKVLGKKEIEINSDLLAAARALCGRSEGVACILGTGSNSCLFNGNEITENTPSLGFILGDEGGGAHLGRQLISDCLKKQLSADICKKFIEQYNLNTADILKKVYHTPLPNRYLASFVPFLAENRKNAEISSLVKRCFVQFLQRNIVVYRHSWLPIHVLGSVGVTFAEEIKEAAESLGLSIGKIVQSPINGLVEYHSKE